MPSAGANASTCPRSPRPTGALRGSLRCATAYRRRGAAVARVPLRIPDHGGRNAPFAVEHGLANITESPRPVELLRPGGRACTAAHPLCHAGRGRHPRPSCTPKTGPASNRSSTRRWRRPFRRATPASEAATAAGSSVGATLNDLRFQRLTVRPGPGGELVIAVWRPFE